MVAAVPERWGTCKLCGNDAELQDSHVVSSWCYERIRYMDGERAPELVFNPADKNISVASNEPLTEYMLCRACEQRFSDEGEDYVARIALQKSGAFPWFDELALWNVRAAHVVNSLARDIKQIVHFAVGTVWRGSACEKLTRVELAEHEPSVRGYLRGAAPLPANVWVHAYLLVDPFVRLVILAPSMARTRSARIFEFVAAGMRFRVHVGAVHPYTAALCMARTGSVIIDHGADLARMLIEDIQPRESVAKLAKTDPARTGLPYRAKRK